MTNQELLEKANLAGIEAFRALKPKPMVVVQHANPFDDRSETVFRDTVADGVCGFAWVVVKPGNSSFARYLTSMGASKHHEGGVSWWVFIDGSQSYEKKVAYANAFAKVLQDAGIRAYVGSRLD